MLLYGKDADVVAVADGGAASAGWVLCWFLGMMLMALLLLALLIAMAVWWWLSRPPTVLLHPESFILLLHALVAASVPRYVSVPRP
jgi:hypothetical protein